MDEREIYVRKITRALEEADAEILKRIYRLLRKMLDRKVGQRYEEEAGSAVADS